MSYEACQNCRYAIEHKDEKNIGQTVYICRRNPPNVALLPTNQGIIQQNVFPVMQGEDYCFQFDLLPPKIEH